MVCLRRVHHVVEALALRDRCLGVCRPLTSKEYHACFIATRCRCCKRASPKRRLLRSLLHAWLRQLELLGLQGPHGSHPNLR